MSCYILPLPRWHQLLSGFRELACEKPQSSLPLPHPPFYRLGNQGPERVNDSAKGTQPSLKPSPRPTGLRLQLACTCVRTDLGTSQQRSRRKGPLFFSLSPKKISFLFSGTSLVAQWWRIHLPMQKTQVQSLIQEDPTCRGATKPEHHSYSWARAPESGSPNYWRPVPHLLKPPRPRDHALPQEKLRQQEAHTPQQRVTPALCSWRKARSATKTQHG